MFVLQTIIFKYRYNSYRPKWVFILLQHFQLSCVLYRYVNCILSGSKRHKSIYLCAYLDYLMVSGIMTRLGCGAVNERNHSMTYRGTIWVENGWYENVIF